MSNEFCTLIKSQDEAVELLEKIEAVSKIRWCDGDESPSEFIPDDYPIWLLYNGQLGASFFSHFGRELTASEFISECQRRMPK